MPNLSRSTLYRCLKRRGLSRIGRTATWPPLTTAALKGPYSFEITAHEVVFHDPDGVLDLIFPVLLASKRSRSMFMRRSRRLRLKRQRRFSSTWSLNPPKRSLRSAPNCIRRSPTGERGSTKTWPRLVLIPSQSPAAPTGSPTSDRPRLMRSPRKSVPEASKSDSGAFGSILPVGCIRKACWA